MGSNALIAAFGFEARSGKDTCCDYLYNAYKGSSILRTSFAKRLRFEVHEAVQDIAGKYLCPPREAMEILCIRKGVQFDPFAKPEGIDIYGKQRFLLQYWGMMRRVEHPDYWVDRVDDEIEQIKPDLVLISDLRFKNEAAWVKSRSGYTVHVYRPDNKGLDETAAKHVSEQELIDHQFDYKITNDGSLKQLHYRANATFHNILQRKLF